MKKIVDSIDSKQQKFYLCSHIAQYMGLTNLDDYNKRIFNHHFKNTDNDLVKNVNNILDEMEKEKLNTVDQIFILFGHLLEDLNICFKHSRTNKSSYIELLDVKNTEYIYYKNCFINTEKKPCSKNYLFGLVTGEPPKYTMNITKNSLLKHKKCLIINNDNNADLIYGIIVKLTYKDKINDNIENMFNFLNTKYIYKNKKSIDNNIYLFYVIKEDFIKNQIISIDINDNLCNNNKILTFEFYQIEMHFEDNNFRKKIHCDGIHLNDIKKYIDTTNEHTINQTEWISIGNNENLSYNEKICDKKICGIIFRENPIEIILSINGSEKLYDENDINLYKLINQTDKYIINFYIDSSITSHLNLKSIDNFKLLLKNNTMVKFQYIE